LTLTAKKRINLGLMSASSPKRPRKLIADLPKGVSARWVTDGNGRRSVCVRFGKKFTGKIGMSNNLADGSTGTETVSGHLKMHHLWSLQSAPPRTVCV
jgi:hypothetical protein